MLLFKFNKKLPGFTLVETMMTMALTGALAVFAYLGYNNIQKLFHQYNDQSDFIAQINEFDKRLAFISATPGKITQENETSFIFESDSVNYSVEFKREFILIKNGFKTDTFYLEAKNIRVTHEMKSDLQNSALVNRLEMDISFSKQKFSLSLNKNYDALTKYNLEKEN
jgi:prepilin-type N-terminal cleavage/methylation domain-containing protein